MVPFVVDFYAVVSVPEITGRRSFVNINKKADYSASVPMYFLLKAIS